MLLVSSVRAAGFPIHCRLSPLRHLSSTSAAAGTIAASGNEKKIMRGLTAATGCQGVYLTDVQAHTSSSLP